MSEVIPAIGAGFAAVAATSSAVSARAAVRTQREAESPQLVFANVQERPESPVLTVIENVGQGVALWVGFCIVWRKIGAKGQIAPATLWPGRKAQFELPFIPAGEVQGIAWCSDRHKNVHAWNAHDGYKLYQRKDVTSDVDRVFADLYPGTDLAGITFQLAKQKPAP